MSGSPERRPAGIAIIAWLWIASAALMLFGSLLGGAGYFAAPGMFDGIAANPPPGLEWMSGMFHHAALLFVFQFTLGAIALQSAVSLLHLKAWARTAVEILCWIGIGYFIACGVMSTHLCLSLGRQPFAEAAPGLFPLIQLAGICTLILGAALFCVPMAIMIRYLRSDAARRAVSQ